MSIIEAHGWESEPGPRVRSSLIPKRGWRWEVAWPTSRL